MKKNQSFILVFYFLFTTACSGSALINEIIADAGFSESAEEALSVAVVHSGTPDEAGLYPDYLTEEGTKVFQNDLGITITLEKAGVSWGSLHLMEACEGDHDAEIALMSIENFLADDLASVILATDSVADTSYCQYEIHLSPENEESSGVDEFPEMMGYAVYVSGSWSYDGESGTFEIAVDDEIEMAGDFSTSEDDENSLSVVFGNYYDRFFDGMDFSESDATLQEELVENLRLNFITF